MRLLLSAHALRTWGKRIDGVEFVTAEEADRWREVFQAEHGGLRNQHRVKVFGGIVTASERSTPCS